MLGIYGLVFIVPNLTICEFKRTLVHLRSGDGCRDSLQRLQQQRASVAAAVAFAAAAHRNARNHEIDKNRILIPPCMNSLQFPYYYFAILLSFLIIPLRFFHQPV